MQKKNLLFALSIAWAMLLTPHLSVKAQSALWTNRLNGAGDNADRYNRAGKDAPGN